MSEKLLTDIGETFLQIKEKVKLTAEEAGRDENEITVMAVTKTVSPQKINEAVYSGCGLLGENRVQEFLGKYEEYDKNAEIHFIGHLQKNKVKYIVDKVSMIESVDSVKLAEEIDRRCKEIGKSMDILLEINIADESNKSGFSYDEIEASIDEIERFSNLRLRGFMTIGRFGAKIEETEQYFQKMHTLLVDIRAKKRDNKYVNILSMGMSSDYELAVKNGATIVRIGRGLFGDRK